MADLRELYQEIIIDHGRHPRNFGQLSLANFQQEGFNPLCGDRLHLYMQVEHDVIQEITFTGEGCAISQSSASLMTETLKGKTLKEAGEIFKAFHLLVTDGNLNETMRSQLGKLMVLQGVVEFPARVKCATLAWHTLKAAINCEQRTVTTEDNL